MKAWTVVLVCALAGPAWSAAPAGSAKAVAVTEEATETVAPSWQARVAGTLGLQEGQVVWVGGLLALLAGAGGLAWMRRGRKFDAPADLSTLSFQSGPDRSLPKDYSPQNVGNDASARPWENSSLAQHGAGSSATAVGVPPQWGVPASFDAESFLQASKQNFVQLQSAWDRADVSALRAMMTPEMIAQIQPQLLEREQQAAASQLTEVVMLEAKLLGMEELASEWVASVEFSGMIREEPAAGPNPFREVWSITRPKAGESAWSVAGVQALQ